MEESAEEAIKRDETLRIYNSTKEALKIIADVARDTITEPIPPPIRTYDTLSTPTINK
jgi:dynamin 1/3